MGLTLEEILTAANCTRQAENEENIAAMEMLENTWFSWEGIGDDE